MKVLQELLDLIIPPEEEFDFLAEELGNLNVVDKKFRPLLKQSASRQYNTRSDRSELLKTSEFSPDLGRDVKVEDGGTVKTAADLHKAITDPDREADKLRLIILSAGEDQFGLIKRYPWTNAEYERDADNKVTTTISKPAEYRYEFFIDISYLSHHVKEGSEITFSDALKKAKFIDSAKPSETENDWRGPHEVLSSQPITDNGLYGQLGIIMKVLKETTLPKEVKLTLIFPDLRRLVTHKERYDTRKLPTDDNKSFSRVARDPGDNAKIKPDLFKKDERGRYVNEKNNKSYFKYAKDGLQARLSQFKLTKADNVQAAEELIDLVKKKGFPKFMKVKGISYKLDSMNYISYENLTQSSSWTPNVTYRRDDDTPEFEVIRKKIKMLKQMFGDGWQDDPDYERAKAKFWPPSEIKIKLVLGPGGIIADSILTSN